MKFNEEKYVLVKDPSKPLVLTPEQQLTISGDFYASVGGGFVFFFVIISW